jgi:hypothetical protein
MESTPPLTASTYLPAGTFASISGINLSSYLSGGVSLYLRGA